MRWIVEEIRDDVIKLWQFLLLLKAALFLLNICCECFQPWRDQGDKLLHLDYIAHVQLEILEPSICLRVLVCKLFKSFPIIIDGLPFLIDGKLVSQSRWLLLILEVCQDVFWLLKILDI